MGIKVEELRYCGRLKDILAFIDGLYARGLRANHVDSLAAATLASPAGCRIWQDRAPRYLRPTEVDVLVGDASKARNKLRWSPRVDFEGLVQMMVAADLDREGQLHRKVQS